MISERVLTGGQYAAELEDPAVYRRRRERVRRELELGEVALLIGAGDDRGYGDVGTFRQEPAFFYLTGVELPNAVLMMTREEETLFLPARRPALEAWTGPKLGPGKETASLLGFDAVLDRAPTEVVLDARRRPVPGFEDRLAAAVAGGTVWVPLPSPSAEGRLGPEQRLLAALRDRVASFGVQDLSPLLADLR